MLQARETGLMLTPTWTVTLMYPLLGSVFFDILKQEFDLHLQLEFELVVMNH